MADGYVTGSHAWLLGKPPCIRFPEGGDVQLPAPNPSDCGCQTAYVYALDASFALADTDGEVNVLTYAKESMPTSTASSPSLQTIAGPAYIINPNYDASGDPGIYWFQFSVDFAPTDTNVGARIIRVRNHGGVIADNVLQPFSNQNLGVSNTLRVDGQLQIDNGGSSITVTVETTNSTGTVNVVGFTGILMRAIPGQ